MALYCIECVFCFVFTVVCVHCMPHHTLSRPVNKDVNCLRVHCKLLPLNKATSPHQVALHIVKSTIINTLMYIRVG